MFTQDDVVFQYTRKQAVEDGVQVNLSEKFPEDCGGYKIPVFCTQQVWELIESAVNNPKTMNDFSGVIYDICWMSGQAPGRKAIANGAGVEFTVIVTGASITPTFYEDNFPTYRLHAVVEAMDIDDPSPVVTISFPDEN